MAFFWTVRLLILLSVLLFSVVVLGLSANFISKYSSFTVPGIVSFTTPAWPKLAVASAALTILCVLPMVAIDFLRRGAATSWVMVELIVLSILSILWLADAADVTANTNLDYLARVGLPKTCQGLDDLAIDVDALEISNPEEFGFLKSIDFDQFGMLCRSQTAVQAFGFLCWILLMGYAIALFILALIASHRSHPAVWSSTVRDTNFLKPKEASSVHATEVGVPMTEQKYAA